MDNKKFYTVRGYQLLEQSSGVLTPSLEDYLEMIYRSVLYDGHIRVNELADHLNVKPSSASKMIIKLKDLGFIDYEKYGIIRLTKKGSQVGQFLLWRHNTLCNFFTLIANGNPEKSFVETELVEHILSRETVQNLEKILLFFKNNESVLKQLKDYLSQ